MFKQPKHHIYKNGGSDAAFNNSGYYRGENKQLYWWMPSHEPLKTTNYSRKFGFTRQGTSKSTQTVKRTQENIEWEGVVGSLVAATIAANFELWTWKCQGCYHMVSNQFWISDVMHITLFVKVGLPNVKINTRQLLFLRLLTTCACGRRARLRTL